jgi:hypothetical protein
MQPAASIGAERGLLRLVLVPGSVRDAARCVR